LDTEINHFTIIKRSKLKVSFDKGWWKNKNEISGEKWLRKIIGAFISHEIFISFHNADLIHYFINEEF
jgi:hypothetical protein